MKPQEVTENDILFNKLYTNLPYTKVHSFEDCMIYYNVKIGYVNSMVEEINNKIKELSLPLIAKSNATNHIFKDSIIVEPINK
jgi:hypothetical protein